MVPRPRPILSATALLYTYHISSEQIWKQKHHTERRGDEITVWSAYLDLDRPWEVTDVDIKGNIGVASKGELLTGETVSVFLDVSFGHNGHLLSRDGSSCWGKEFTFSTLPFGVQIAQLHTEMELQHIIINPLMGLSSHLGQECSHKQLVLLCLKCIKLVFGWP